MFVDSAKLSLIPFYLWPIVLICPIYPLLLAIVWTMRLRKQKTNSYLLAFAALPSAVFGILALIYYPAQLYYTKFNWNDFGQIFWVLFYSAQGWWLLLREKILTKALVLAGIYLLVKFTIDIKYQTFGYLEIANLPTHVQMAVYFVSIGATLGLVLYKLVKK